MSVQHDHTLNPVTALEFYNEQLLFAGEGVHLKIFDARTSTLLYQWKIFDSQTIHGIAISSITESEDDLCVVVWGGPSVTLLTSRTIKDLLDVNTNAKVNDITPLSTSTPDWILDAIILPSGRCSVLITAHNTVLQASLGQGKSVVLNLLSSPSRSILYSAHLIWEATQNLVLVAAGTVFGEIIIWRCAVRKDQLIPYRYHVLCTLTGHEGSIFGVQISPIIGNQSGKMTRLLASCSDDRTIRVWDIYDLSLPRAASFGDEGTDFEASLAREIGYGDKRAFTTSKFLAMAMGHASRIWGVKFYLNGNSRMNLLSFGEDATTQLWKLANSWNELTHKETYAFHSGKHIFSTAIQRQSSHKYLATGGADGKISLYKLPDLVESSSIITWNQSATMPMNQLLAEQVQDENSAVEDSQMAAWDLNSILESLSANVANHTATSKPPDLEVPQDTVQEEAHPKATTNLETAGVEVKGTKTKILKPKKVPRDVFSRYAFVSENDLLVTTTFGRVLLGHIGRSVQWREMLLSSAESLSLKAYSVVKGLPLLGLCFLAGKNVVYMYEAVPVNAEILPGSELVHVTSMSGKVGDIFPLFSQENKSLDLLIITLGSGNATVIPLKPTPAGGYQAQSRTIVLPEKFVVRSAAIIRGNLLLLGSRSGSIAIYSRSDECVGVWPCHDDAITSIVDLTESRTSPTQTQNLLTTARDGTFSIVAMSFEGEGPRISLRPIHNSSPPFGPMIEAAWFNNKDLLLCGFRSTNFVVWNEAKQCEIVSIDCGGAHRSYAYSPLLSPGRGGHFVYTKASELCLHSKKGISHNTVKPGGHGREIKACAVSPDKTLVATGAEDTTVRIWKYCDRESPISRYFEALAVLKKHTAGIQQVQWYGSKYLFSSGGNEEFFVWAVTTIPGFGVGVVCEASCPDPSEEQDLRIMSFDISHMPNSINRRSDIVMEKETCSMPTLQISLAYSDSTFRSYSYSKTEGFHCLARGRYTSSCLTQIRHVSTSSGETTVLTAATDGKLALWIAKTSKGTLGEYTLISIQKLHQNAIKSLDIVCPLDKTYTLVATGGDDNALGITIFMLSDTSSFISRRSLIKSAHAAAITGLCIISHSGKEMRIVSTGNDQRVREWRLDVDNTNVVAVSKQGDVFTSIADVGDMAVLKDGKILVAGNGMEVFSV